MNTIVLNTLTGAVSEYSNFGFQSITPTHAGSVTGLYALGGDLDVLAPVVSTVTTGKTLLGASLKKFLGMVFFSVRGSGIATVTVAGSAVSYNYSFPIRASGESRCQPGRGIRENYLAFGFSNVAGADFQLDRIEVEVAQSNSRRT
jgi:hypothetical protein